MKHFSFLSLTLQLLLLKYAYSDTYVGTKDACAPIGTKQGFIAMFREYAIDIPDGSHLIEKNWVISDYKSEPIIHTVEGVTDTYIKGGPIGTDTYNEKVEYGEIYGYYTTITNFSVELVGYFYAEESGHYKMNYKGTDAFVAWWGSPDAFQCCQSSNSTGTTIYDYYYANGDDSSNTVGSLDVTLTGGAYYPLRVHYVNIIGPGPLNMTVITPSSSTISIFSNVYYQTTTSSGVCPFTTPTVTHTVTFTSGIPYTGTLPTATTEVTVEYSTNSDGATVPYIETLTEPEVWRTKYIGLTTPTVTHTVTFTSGIPYTGTLPTDTTEVIVGSSTSGTVVVPFSKTTDVPQKFLTSWVGLTSSSSSATSSSSAGPSSSSNSVTSSSSAGPSTSSSSVVSSSSTGPSSSSSAAKSSSSAGPSTYSSSVKSSSSIGLTTPTVTHTVTFTSGVPYTGTLPTDTTEVIIASSTSGTVVVPFSKTTDVPEKFQTKYIGLTTPTVTHTVTFTSGVPYTGTLPTDTTEVIIGSSTSGTVVVPFSKSTDVPQKFLTSWVGLTSFSSTSNPASSTGSSSSVKPTSSSSPASSSSSAKPTTSSSNHEPTKTKYITLSSGQPWNPSTLPQHTTEVVTRSSTSGSVVVPYSSTETDTLVYSTTIINPTHSSSSTKPTSHPPKTDSKVVTITPGESTSLPTITTEVYTSGTKVYSTTVPVVYSTVTKTPFHETDHSIITITPGESTSLPTVTTEVVTSGSKKYTHTIPIIWSTVTKTPFHETDHSIITITPGESTSLPTVTTEVVTSGSKKYTHTIPIIWSTVTRTPFHETDHSVVTITPGQSTSLPTVTTEVVTSGSHTYKHTIPIIWSTVTKTPFHKTEHSVVTITPGESTSLPTVTTEVFTSGSVVYSETVPIIWSTVTKFLETSTGPEPTITETITLSSGEPWNPNTLPSETTEVVTAYSKSGNKLVPYLSTETDHIVYRTKRIPNRGNYTFSPSLASTKPKESSVVPTKPVVPPTSPAVIPATKSSVTPPAKGTTIISTVTLSGKSGHYTTIITTICSPSQSPNTPAKVTSKPTSVLTQVVTTTITKDNGGNGGSNGGNGNNGNGNNGNGNNGNGNNGNGNNGGSVLTNTVTTTITKGNGGSGGNGDSGSSPTVPAAAANTPASGGSGSGSPGSGSPGSGSSGSGSGSGSPGSGSSGSSGSNGSGSYSGSGSSSNVLPAEETESQVPVAEGGASTSKASGSILVAILGVAAFTFVL